MLALELSIIAFSVNSKLSLNFIVFWSIKAAKRASVAAAPLAVWTKANIKYSVVLEKIEPLENEQAQLQK